MVAVTTSGCSVAEVLRFGWPIGVTPEATQMRTLWTWAAVAALVVGAIVWGLTAWTVAFHRKRAGASDLPRQFQYNLPLELVLTVVPLVIVAVLFYFTVVVQNVVDRECGGQRTAGHRHRLPVELGVRLPGDHRRRTACPVAVVGTTSSVPILVLPVDRPIAFTQESKDVIHSFWVPEFLFKRDVMPNPAENDQKNTWVIDRIERPGAFVGRCAEFCGAYHSMMNFEVRALPPAQFDQFLQTPPADQPADRTGLHHQRRPRGDELRRALQPRVDHHAARQPGPDGPAGVQVIAPPTLSRARTR